MLINVIMAVFSSLSHLGFFAPVFKVAFFILFGLTFHKYFSDNVLFCFSHSGISFLKCYHNYLMGIVVQPFHPPIPFSRLFLLFNKHLQPSAESSSPCEEERHVTVQNQGSIL